jgi:hypothetical protein
MARNASHNHRRKLIRKCRREAFSKKWATPIPVAEWRALRQKGHELFREKVAAMVKEREGVGIPLTAFIPEQVPA